MKRMILVLLIGLCLITTTINAQEIQLTHQVIASSPVEADAYSWTVLVNGTRKPHEDADKKTIIVTFHGSGQVLLILSVVTKDGLQTFVSEATPKPGPNPNPDPEPPPIPKPEGVASLVVVAESANRTPSQQKLFVSIQTKYKRHPVLILDPDSKNNTVAIKAAVDEGIPALVFLDADGNVITVKSLPDTYDEFVEVTK